MGAAPSCSHGPRRLRRSYAIVAIALFCLVAGRADAHRIGPQQSWRPIWAVEVEWPQQVHRGTLQFLHENGVNALIVSRSHWTDAAHRRLAAAAFRNGLELIEPRRSPTTASATAAFGRACAHHPGPVRACALRARSIREAKSLARTASAQFVVVDVSGPGAVRALRPNRSGRTRIIAVAPWSLRRQLDASAWSSAIAASGADPATSVAVAPTSSLSREGIGGFLSLVGGKTPASAPTDTSPPTAPSGLQVSQSTRSSITVTWQPAQDDVGVVAYEVTADGASLGSTSTTQATLDNLVCGTTHVVSVVAVDAAGHRSPSATVTAATLACAGGGGGGGGGGSGGGAAAPLAVAPATPLPDTTPPSAPAGVHISAATGSSLVVSWGASTDDVAVAGYGVYRAGALDGSTSSTSYTLAGLSCGTTYSVSVDAFDAAGNRSTQSSISAATSACAPAGDVLPPSTPLGLVASSAAQTSVTLGWSPSTDDVGVAGYGVYLGGATAGSSSSTSYLVGGLVCGTSYSFAVDAYDAAGNRSGKASVVASTLACPATGDAQAPTTPSALAATGSTQTSISVSWNPSSDNVGVAGYGVYQSGASVGSTPATSYTVAGLTCGSTYTIGVDAYDAAGNRSARATVSASTLACPDTQAPTAPASFRSTGATTTSVSLAWNASSDNVGVAGYGVYRGATSVGSTVGTSYTVTGLSCGTSYTFSVDAYDAAGNRSTKASANVSTAACPDTTPPSSPSSLQSTGATGTSVSLSWSASSDNVGVVGYGVYQGVTSVGSTSGTAYTVSGLSCGTSYSLSVDAFDAAGNRSAKASVTVSTAACPDTTPPTAPSSLQSTGATVSSVSLSWSASSDNVGVAGYGVYQGASSVGSTAGTSYTVSGLSCGTSYSFSVDAYDAAGNRSGKVVVTASTAACAGAGSGGAVANLWVDTNGGSCARAASAGSYADASACGSFASAWSAAQCGDTVGVVAGSYGGQTLSTAKSCSSSSPVTFVASGAVSLTGGLDVATSYLSFSGPFSFAKTYTVEQGASYVSFLGVSAPHAFVLGSYVTIKGGQIGPNNVCQTGWEDGLQIWDNGSVSATHVTVDGVTFHDITDNGNQCAGSANSGVHVDCVQLLGPSWVTIQNSTFYNCATSGVMARPFTTPLHDILIQNNMIGPIVTPGASINIGNTSDTCNNVVVQYNTAIDTYPSLICGGSGSSGNVVRGNIFTGYYAQAGFSSSYNITSATGATGTGSKKCTPVFNPTSTTTANYHLAATDTCARNAGDPNNYPATDIDGDTRPTGATTPDAGADEIS